MIDKITVQRGLALLKWLPVIAAAAFVFGAGSKAASAQTTCSTIGYVVTGCDIDSDNGDYYYIGTDWSGHPYYQSASGVYLCMAPDDENNRDYDRWYINADAYAYEGNILFYQGGDYETNGIGGYYEGESYYGPATNLTPGSIVDWTAQPGYDTVVTSM